ncbi:MAG: hypothetical protein II350_07735 [Clostridia bacterium]|nr:hypothetical protein [Clostridia bacterium]
MRDGISNYEFRTPEEKLLAKQAVDKSNLAEKSSVVANTKFLTPAEAAFLKEFCRRNRLEVWFDGGKAGAERVAAVFIPEWQREYLSEEEREEISPVAVLKVTNTAGAELSHRDYLGALMASGIRRDVIGDIDVHGSEGFVFCLRDMAEYIVQNVESAGRAKLCWEFAERADVPAGDGGDGEEIYYTVPSLRLDAIVAEGFNLSREDAKTLVVQGACSIDHVPCEKPDAAVECGSLISVRGKGRLRFDRVRGETRRGRVGIELTRFGKRR